MNKSKNINDAVFKEFIKYGPEKKGQNQIWKITNSKILYMSPELAKGFLDLCNHELYRKKIAEREIALIKKHTSNFLKNINAEKINLIDLGCGDGTKAKELIAQIDKKIKIRYCPVDINKTFVDKAIKNIKNAKFKNVIEFKPTVKDFANVGEISATIRNGNFQTNVILQLGNTLASLEINEFLFKGSHGMFSGDHLIIGNGIRKGKRLVSLETYKNKLFDNWLINLMTGLGFKKNEVDFDARFANSRVEFFYKINTDKTISNKDKQIAFKNGDEILVAHLHKLFPEELNKFCKMYFSNVDLKKDKEDEYALVFCKK